MRKQVFQQILDETPKEVESLVRQYASNILKKNRVISQQGTDNKATNNPLK